MEEKSRGQWTSGFGFLMAAVGSAVGLGNIWGFPYKMGANGGFAFLVLYLILAAIVGVAVMVGEIALGRRTGMGAVGTYIALSKRFKWVGWLGAVSAFLIMGFYSVIGGYVIKYFVLNLGMIFGAAPGAGGDIFNALLLNPVEGVVYTFVFMVATCVIVMGGIAGGIEKFSKVAMPALAVMLLIIIVRAVTLDGAAAGLAFMLKPNFQPLRDDFLGVLKTASGQMFFSLSLGMGCMLTYGSYLSKKENVEKNSWLIVVSDTIVALLAGFAVVPAAFALNGKASAGPGLLFVVMQDVFAKMGALGGLFGAIFYLLVIIAAVSSSISLVEVVTTFFMDSAKAKGKEGNRKAIAIWVCVVMMVLAAITAIDGLGANEKFWKPLGFAWIDFFDLWSEGIFMPLGALFMSLMIGWELGVKRFFDDILGGESFKTRKLFEISIKFIVPVGMLIVLWGQLQSFGILK